jgi:large subunit ribosomal protein L20
MFLMRMRVKYGGYCLMVRISTAVSTHKRKKRVLKQAKGQFGQRSRRFQQAKRSVIKGMAYEYRDRKVKKREFKRLWIIRINAACKEEGINYSRFVKGLTDANVTINRKVIADLAVNAPETFQQLVKISKEAQASK